MTAERNERYENYFTSDGLKQAVVPSGMPPEGYISKTFWRDVLRQLPDRERQITTWGTAALAAFEGSGLKAIIPGFRFATFGLADPFQDNTEELAVFAYLDPDAPENRWGISIAELQVGSHIFRVLLRIDQEIKDINLHPSDGTQAIGRSCCYARRKSGGHLMLMTAKHIVDQLLPNSMQGGEWLPLMDPDPMRNPNNDVSIGKVRVFNQLPDQLDAALIEPLPAIAPKIMQFTPPLGTLVVGRAVNLELSTGPINARVVEVQQLSNVRIELTPAKLLGVRVMIDHYAISGDSGSLISDCSTLDGIAIYTGKLDQTGIAKTATSRLTNPIVGVGQYLGQAAEAMQVDLLKE